MRHSVLTFIGLCAWLCAPIYAADAPAGGAKGGQSSHAGEQASADEKKDAAEKTDREKAEEQSQKDRDALLAELKEKFPDTDEANPSEGDLRDLNDRLNKAIEELQKQVDAATGERKEELQKQLDALTAQQTRVALQLDRMQAAAQAKIDDAKHQKEVDSALRQIEALQELQKAQAKAPAPEEPPVPLGHQRTPGDAPEASSPAPSGGNVISRRQGSSSPARPSNSFGYTERAPAGQGGAMTDRTTTRVSDEGTGGVPASASPSPANAAAAFSGGVTAAPNRAIPTLENNFNPTVGAEPSVNPAPNSVLIAKITASGAPVASITSGTTGTVAAAAAPAPVVAPPRAPASEAFTANNESYVPRNPDIGKTAASLYQPPTSTTASASDSYSGSYASSGGSVYAEPVSPAVSGGTTSRAASSPPEAKYIPGIAVVGNDERPVPFEMAAREIPTGPSSTSGTVGATSGATSDRDRAATSGNPAPLKLEAYGDPLADSREAPTWEGALIVGMPWAATKTTTAGVALTNPTVRGAVASRKTSPKKTGGLTDFHRDLIARKGN